MRAALLTLTGILASCLTYAQQNHAPIVTIKSPKPGSTLPLNTLIPYAITVSDKEDGESKYGEINPSEVFLTVRYLSDSSQVTQARKEAATPDPAGFVLLQKSNCTSCHAFDGPLIGPSYSQIAKKYPPALANQALLSQRIIKGSSGIWGSTPMASHPELSAEAAGKIIDWILTNAGKQGILYYPGLEGVIKLIVPPGEIPGGVFLLRAGYTDHGPDTWMFGGDVREFSVKD